MQSRYSAEKLDAFWLKAIQNLHGKSGGVVVAIHLPTKTLHIPPSQQWQIFR